MNMCSPDLPLLQTIWWYVKQVLSVLVTFGVLVFVPLGSLMLWHGLLIWRAKQRRE